MPHPRHGLVAASLCGALLFLATALPTSHAQSAPCGITHLPPTSIKLYPPIAKAAHVSGTVILLASFDHEGTPKVTKIIGGPEMLKKSAAQFVETSQADPSTGSRECPVVVSFEFVGPATCDIPPDPNPPFATKDKQHFSVYGTTYMLCDPAVTITKRHSFLFFHWTTTPNLADLATLSKV
jgi:hypothetical protein